MNALTRFLAVAALALGVAAPLRAAVTVSVDMDPATSGIQSSRAVGAGEVITVDLVMTVGAEGVSSYGISATFDSAELTLNGSPAATELLPAGFAFNFNPGVNSESQALAAVRTFEAGTLGNGPVNTSFVIGSIRFTATAPATNGTADVTLGLFNPGVDGCFDNAGNASTPTFVSGKVDLPLLLVTSAADSGAGSLRAVLATAAGLAGADVIRFAPTVSPFRVESVTTLSATSIAVRYSRAADAGTATDTFNYIGGGGVLFPIGATLSGDGRTVTLTLDSALGTGTYLLDILSVTASNGDPLVPNPTTVNFSGTVGAVITNGVPPVTRITFASEIAASDATGPVTIDGAGVTGGLVLDGGAGANRLFSIASGTTLHLRNLTLTGGNGTGATASGSGGAIYNAGTVSLTDCSITGNVVPSGAVGGALWSTGASSSATILRCVFSGNGTSGGSNGGGAIYADTSTTLLCTDSTFTGNTSPNTAGAIHSIGGANATARRCTFTNNTAVTAGAGAGAVRATGANFLLEQCTLTGNTAVAEGGVAICTGASTMTLRHCTVSGNSAATGGGVRFTGGTLVVENSIVAGNTATTSGPDFSQTAGTLTRAGRNVIGNNATVTGTFATGAPNANGDFVGTGASPVNALLAPLGDYGGLTQTRALLPGSPARNNSSGSTVTGDQRGFLLVGTADIGAYEAGTFNSYTTWIWESLPTAGNGTLTDPLHAATFDFDGDGVTNGNEWLALTSPADSTSYLRVIQFTRPSPNVIVTFPSALGRSYTFESSPDLVTWTPIAGAPVPGTGSNLVIQLGPFSGATRLFVKVRTGP